MISSKEMYCMTHCLYQSLNAHLLYYPVSLICLPNITLNIAGGAEEGILTFIGEQITNISDECVSNEHRGSSFGEQK